MVYFCQTYLIIRSSLTNTFTLTEKVLRRNEKTDYILIPIEIKFKRKRERNEEQKGEREKLNNRSSRFLPNFPISLG